MKTQKKHFKILVTFMIFCIVLVSCSTPKKTAVSCPDFSLNKDIKVLKYHKGIKNKVLVAQYKLNKRSRPVSFSKKNQTNEIIVSKDSPDVLDIGIKSIPFLSKIEYTQRLTASIENTIIPLYINNIASQSINKASISDVSNDFFTPGPSPCDTIVLRSGALITGKVEEIGQTEIKFRRCENLTGPVISILKSDISVINYPNGTSDFFTSSNSNVSNQNNISFNVTKKTEGLGLTGFISSIVGLFVASIPLGLMAIIFGSISLSRIKKDPDRYKGKGFAITSIIVGLIDVIAMILILV